MKYSYTALTTDNKKISGVLEAKDQQAGEAELHRMGVAIIAFEEISDAEFEKLKKEENTKKEESGIKTFTFLAVDPNNQEVEGTIDATEGYTAYKRLINEYKFKVKNLYASNATEAEINAAPGILEGYTARLTEEQSENKIKNGDSNTEGEKKIHEEVIKEIDAVIISSKKILESHNDFFSISLIGEIEKKLGQLERVRSSNNIKHITEISNELYELVSNPDKTEGKDIGQEFKAIIGEMEDSALVKKEFDLYKKAVEASGVNKIFDKITEKLKAITESTDEEKNKKPSIISKLKLSIHNKLSKLTSRKKKKEKEPSKITIAITEFFKLLKAESPAIKKARKKELKNALKALFSKSDKKTKEDNSEKADTTTKVKTENEKRIEKKRAVKAKPEKRGKLDFTAFFVEIDSFLGWLLSFYIIFFFMVNISLEKNIILSREFIFKTMKSPLILNITIFILVLHFILRIRNLHFRNNILGTLFLLFLGIGSYAFLIINF